MEKNNFKIDYAQYSFFNNSQAVIKNVYGFVSLWLLVIIVMLQSLYLMTDFQIQNYQVWFTIEQSPRRD